ncbi:MAG: hypothetical protein EA361_00465 [Bacteroidetes bacterium]|nr:MAG: hypothetical protein EA361_00465 [Bacteroidota bacterium]
MAGINPTSATAGNDNTPRSPISWGIIPALAFDADLGLKYGGVINIFDYGNYDIFPKYHQHLFIRLINTTGGTLQAQALLESDKIIPGVKIIAEASHIKDTRFEFFGFNAANAVFEAPFRDATHAAFISEHFYSLSRSLTRLRIDLQTHITGTSQRLLTGYTFQKFSLHPGTGDFNPLPDNQLFNGSLFELYQQWGVIDRQEAGGGNIHLFSLGWVFDTRNEYCYCTDGIWAETFFLYSPGAAGSFLNHVATLRHHMSTSDDRFTFSYRLSSQQKLSGHKPFYMLPWIFDTSLTQDGPSGAFGLRGAYRNRITGDGFLLSNIEAKMKVLQTNILKNDMYASVAGFFDLVYITQNYPFSTRDIPETARLQFFKEQSQKPHYTFGPGLYLVFNKNNIITINYGFSPQQQMGSGGLYIGSSLLF